MNKTILRLLYPIKYMSCHIVQGLCAVCNAVRQECYLDKPWPNPFIAAPHRSVREKDPLRQKNVPLLSLLRSGFASSSSLIACLTDPQCEFLSDPSL